MNKKIYGIPLPQELQEYYNINHFDKINEYLNFELPGIDIIRNCTGNITSVRYYSKKRELIKQIFYEYECIKKIEYYDDNILEYTDMYDSNRLVSKCLFNKKGDLLQSIRFRNNAEPMPTTIYKKYVDRSVRINYSYDAMDRLVKRVILLDEQEVQTQEYIYDILDRVVEYKDNERKITVKKFGNNHELLDFEINDKMNNIVVENCFNNANYRYTKITLNGHSCIINDISCVDNIMLKNTHTSEDELDFIIANLLSSDLKNFSLYKQQKLENADSAGPDLEVRILPISMRKWLLYNRVAKAI